MKATEPLFMDKLDSMNKGFKRLWFRILCVLLFLTFLYTDDWYMWNYVLLIARLKLTYFITHWK